MYFNNFLFRPIGRLVGQDAHPTAFLFQKLGFAGVSIVAIRCGRYYEVFIILFLY
ncbi:MAG: hypothetical protein IK065_04865 [Neisseriaceae bacterium]|nr:hypothetical protein [Neisseriaceae bacterium]